MNEYNDVSYTVLSDRIEAATYMAVAAATGSTITLENAPVNDLDSIIAMLRAMGVYIVSNSKSELTIIAPSRLRPLDIVTTMPHPGFPTDAQAILMATLLKAKGSSMIVENIFERRYNHIPELIKMGADIAVNGNTAKVSGVEKLNGAVVAAKDLRAGASLIIAALQAEGETTIYDVHHIDRGYENIVGKLRNIGADIREMGDGSEKWAAFFTS
jgi:UDP-N-acetylglucosamine 1-carboxyvinyltransferase